MRLAAIVLLLLSSAASAQNQLAPAELAQVLRDFEPHIPEKPLRCEVTPIRPVISFAFRVEAGYAFHVPASQYSGAAPGAWSSLIAITPEKGEPTYLLERTQFSDARRVDSDFVIHGVYFLGVGRYQVESTLRDERNRVCRKQWRITVAPSHADRAIPLALPPGAVRELSSQLSPRVQRDDDAPPMRYSILLNAAAFSARRTVIRPLDRAVLNGALTSLIEHLPATSIRLVVFSLEQQREVYRAENFSPSGMDQVVDAIRSLDETTVDVHVLQKPMGHVEFLAGLIRGECNGPDPSDAAIILGPTSRYWNRIPPGVLPPAEGLPRFFYIRYEAPRRPPGVNAPEPGMPDRGSGNGGGNGGNGGGSGRGSQMRNESHVQAPAPLSVSTDGLPDMITAAVRAMKGKTIIIHAPAELASAIRKVEGLK